MQETDPIERKNRINLIKEDFEGIFPLYEAFYIQAVIYHAAAADDAFQRFAVGVTQGRDAASTVSAIHEALTHSASLSRFFWSPRSGGVAKARSEKLRRAFSMEGSPLERRDLRNALEHFDERLDDYLMGDLAGYFFPEPMIDSHELADENIGHIFRLVDVEECVFVLMGEKYGFKAIRSEVRRVLNTARHLDGCGGRLFLEAVAPSDKT